MKITDVRYIHFRSTNSIQRDIIGHAHPGPVHDTVASILCIETDEGVCGYSAPESLFVLNDRAPEEWRKPKNKPAGDPPGAFASGREGYLNKIIKPLLVGEDPLEREKIFHTLYKMQRGGANSSLTDPFLSTIDCALWDLYGRYVNLPVNKLIGGFRKRVEPYASVAVADDFPGGLATPEDYARYCKELVGEGYRAIKLHTWMEDDWKDYNVIGKPDVNKDIACVYAVREAVGPDVELMVDAFHYYDRYDALKLGLAMQECNYLWYEEPMEEYNVEAYKWLKSKLDILIIGPEVAKGKHFTRAEWIANRVCDIARVGPGDVGGFTPMLKVLHTAESFGIPLELHGGGAASLQLMAAMTVPGRYYERGLLHPFMDYVLPPWLNSRMDPMDEEGYIVVSQKPGMGLDLNWDYINDNLVK